MSKRLFLFAVRIERTVHPSTHIGGDIMSTLGPRTAAYKSDRGPVDSLPCLSTPGRLPTKAKGPSQSVFSGSIQGVMEAMWERYT